MVAYQQRGDGVMVKFRTPGDEWALSEVLKGVYFREYDSIVYRDSNAAGVAARRAIYDLGVATGRSEAVRVQKELEKEVARATSLDEVASKLVADLDSLRMAIAPHSVEEGGDAIGGG